MLNRLPYQDFQPITFQEFSAHFRECYQLSEGESREIYHDWLEDLHYNALRFYRAFCERIQLITEQAFRRENHIDNQEGIPYELDEEWEYCWLNEASKTYDVYETLSNHHAARHNNLILKRRGSLHTTAAQLAQEFQQYIKRSGPPTREIDELWFNTTIRTPQDIQAELRQLPYQDYLKTSHWQRVRESMLLIGRAQCREIGCHNSGESWYGGFWESELDVHHLSYKNRGNERYRDLVLLCKRHHKQWHLNKQLLGTPNIEIV